MYECAGLLSVKFPSTVTSIGFEWFAGCPDIASVTSMSTTAPVLSESAFDTAVYDAAELLVPEGALATYKESDGWKLFKNVKEDNFSGIDACADKELTVMADGGRIVVEGADSSLPVEVYGVNGQLIYHGAASDIDVPGAGVYVVKVGKQTVKIVL